MLNLLNIEWIEAPKGFEGECICSYLNIKNQVSAVYSGDTDPIAFGATKLYRKNPRDKKIYEYTQENIIEQIYENIQDNDSDYFTKPIIKKIKNLDEQIGLELIREIAAIMGNDFCEKTPRVGPKTVFKKLKNISLKDDQLSAIEHYKKLPNDSELIFNNQNVESCMTQLNINNFINWLVDEKSFDKERLVKLFDKQLNKTKSQSKTKFKSKTRSKSKSKTRAKSKKSNVSDNSSIDLDLTSDSN